MSASDLPEYGTDIFMETPRAYAEKLAGYISSPTKIESLTRLEFGRAPPLHVIAKMRFRIEQSRKPMRLHVPEAANDGEDWRPASLVKPSRLRTLRVAETVKRPTEEAEPLSLIDNPLAFLGKRIVHATAAAFEMTVAEMTGRSRCRRYVLARAVAVRLLRDQLRENGEHRFSFPQIARLIGRDDHSTAYHAWNEFDVYCRINPEIREVYDTLREAL